MGRSSFDQVNAFLRQRSASAPVPADVAEDVEVLVRRYDRVRSLDEAFQVELSPFMRSLMRTQADHPTAADSERTSAAAGG
jgi:hypothetical protein